MTKEICKKCGKLEDEHPYGYVTPGNNRMQFVWKCKKFVSENQEKSIQSKKIKNLNPFDMMEDPINFTVFERDKYWKKELKKALQKHEDKILKIIDEIKQSPEETIKERLKQKIKQ